MTRQHLFFPRRAPWTVAGALVVAVAACGGEQSNLQPSSSPPIATLDHDAVVARAERERDDAVRRASDAQQEATRALGACQLTQHELDSLRERTSFVQSVWSRLEQTEITERAVRERLAGAARDKRRPIEEALRSVGASRDTVERSVRRVHTVADVDWPRFKHDQESALDGMDRTLRDSAVNRAPGSP